MQCLDCEMGRDLRLVLNKYLPRLPRAVCCGKAVIMTSYVKERAITNDSQAELSSIVCVLIQSHNYLHEICLVMCRGLMAEGWSLRKKFTQIFHNIWGLSHVQHQYYLPGLRSSPPSTLSDGQTTNMRFCCSSWSISRHPGLQIWNTVPYKSK